MCMCGARDDEAKSGDRGLKQSSGSTFILVCQSASFSMHNLVLMFPKKSDLVRGQWQSGLEFALPEHGLGPRRFSLLQHLFRRVRICWCDGLMLSASFDCVWGE